MAYNILGIKIDPVAKNRLEETIKGTLAARQPCYIVTVNPEIILHTQNDEEYFYVINHSYLNIPDGIGLKILSWLLGMNIERITGVHLSERILQIAAENGIKAAVVNWRNGLSSSADIRAALAARFPKLSFIVIDIEREWTMPVYRELQLFAPAVVLATLGAPYQEKWIYHFLKKSPYVSLAVGVGGAFDFMTGKLKRAPSWLGMIGLEWLWRLKEQPHRWRRIYNATFVFTCKFLVWRFIMPWLYRPNVACLLYKKDPAGYKILLVERQDWPGHWQLPQGGIDGMDIAEAGVRELSEEINNHDFKPLKTHNDLWRYEFRPKSNYDNKRHNGYRGQKQSLLIAEFFGKDEEIKINYWDHTGWKWVDADNLVNEVHERRRDSAKIYLEKFREII